MANILMVDFHNCAPHLETSFEIAKRHLDQGDRVSYHFLGHDLPFGEYLVLSYAERIAFRRWLPERRAARMVQSEGFEFVGRTRIDVERFRVPAMKTLEGLKSWTFDGADLGMGVASSLISRTGNSHFDPAKYPKLVSDALTSSVAAYVHCRDLYETQHPDRIYVFNGRLCLARAALRAAQRTDAEIRVHERGADMSKFIVRDYIPHDRVRIQADILRTWSDTAGSAEAVAIARGWYEERRRGKPRDWLSFTDLQVPKTLPDLPSEERIVTYFSSSDDELAAIGDVYRWDGWQDQAEAVTNLIEIASRIPEIQLVIRLHPHLLKKHAEDRIRWLELARAGGTAIVIEPQSDVDSYELVNASDVVVTGGSTIGMEAVYWGRPSILLGPSDYDLLQGVVVARSGAELEALLRNPMLPPDRADSLPYAYYRATFGESFKYYEPTSLLAGRFMGKDIQRLPSVPRLINQLKTFVLSRTRNRMLVRPTAERIRATQTARSS